MRDGSTRARFSIARIMLWVAGVAVVFAGLRPGVPALVSLAAVLAATAVCLDVAFTFLPRTPALRVLLVGRRRMFLSTAMTAEELSRFEAALHAAGFRLESVLFLQSAFQSLCDSPPAPGQEDRAVAGRPGAHHITAAELCASLPSHAATLAGRKALAASLLSSLGLHRGEDVGRLVFTMIDFGLVQRRPDDSHDDFRGLVLLDGSSADA